MRKQPVDLTVYYYRTDDPRLDKKKPIPASSTSPST